MIKKELFDQKVSTYVLGCLMHNPLLLQDEHYVLLEDDFYQPLHKIVFAAIFNMAQEGMERITPKDVDLRISLYDEQYAAFNQAKGFDFVASCYDLVEGRDEKQFNTYYQRLKKFSMLRDLERVGIDTKVFYDTSNALDMEAQDEKLNKLELKQICDTVREDLVTIENKHIGKDNGSAEAVFEGLHELIKSLEEHPEVGLPLDGDILNFATRGARAGKLYTYSAPSGGGKTRYMVGNACAISLPYIDKDGNIVMRDCGYQKVLYVATEQNKDEIQTMVLAYVSGVNEGKILSDLEHVTPDEKKRIKMAMEIIDKYGSNLIIETIPDPSLNLIKARLLKHIIQDGVRYIFYDYIFSSPGLLGEFVSTGVREDVVLMMLSNTLKEIAMSQNVFIQSATQLNDGWSKKETGLRDQNCLRGSKAIADKIDIGLIGVKICPEEYQRIEKIWSELKRQYPQKFTHEPNIVVDIYKNRRGELSGMKVFRYFDYGTLHCEDLFITDAEYNSVANVGKLQFETHSLSYLDLKARGAI